MPTTVFRRFAGPAAVVLTGALLVLAPSPALAARDDRPDHTSVLIDKNSEFTKANGVRAGSGTAADPFVISGWTFHHLEIKDTSSHVRLVNNTFEGSLVLDWIGDGLVVQRNDIGDLRVNQNVKRTGAPTSGRIVDNKIGVVGQLRHFDGRFANNVVGQKTSDTLSDAFDAISPSRAVNFDGFNGAVFEDNLIYGYMDARLHGHHHSSAYGSSSHMHSGHHQHHEMVNHTVRYHEVFIRNNTIYANTNNYALAYLDTAHSANDRTATSETNEELNKPHIHHTRVHITGNKLLGAGLLVDVFNARDQRHTATARGLMDIRNNRVTLLEDRIDPFFNSLHGITVWSAEDIALKVIGNTVLGQADDGQVGDLGTNLWDYDAGIVLQDLNKGRLQFFDNLVTNRSMGIYATQMTKSVRWAVRGLRTRNVDKAIYYDSSVANAPDRRP
jgi:hypothetical protein